jgi:hypothetical protein
LHPKETPSASFSQAAKPFNDMYLQNSSNPFVPTRPSNLCVGQDLQTHVYLQALRELYIAFRGVTTHISLEEHASLLQVPQTVDENDHKCLWTSAPVSHLKIPQPTEAQFVTAVVLEYMTS